MDVAKTAYSLFEVKAMNADSRTFKGWATTPAVDRVGDTINPLGARFKNPLVLLHQHRHDQPIGRVTFGTPTAKGIEFEATIPTVEEPGTLKDRVDTAWGEIKHGLIRAVSIGFRSMKHAFRDDGGIDFQEIEIYELSTVSVPALPQAVITSVKEMNPNLPRDVVRDIRRYDVAARLSAVPLIRSAGRLPSGAVRLGR
jgi:HK97 family phage prohead protease